jgi:dolichol-phosphate mannosyltransferase
VLSAAWPVDMIKTSIILPTYNESGNIENLLKAIEDNLLSLGEPAEIIVVDDNSPDGTANIVRQHQALKAVNVRLIERPDERGLATAIKHGIQESQGEKILVMDTDFNHDPIIIPRMILLLQYYDLVIGSRFVQGGGMEDRARNIFSQVFNGLIRMMLWHKIQDNLSGFFAMRRNALFTLDHDSIFRGYGEFFIRLTYQARRKGLSILEVPVFYKLRKEGQSKSNFVRMLLDYTSCVLSLRFTGK